MLGLLIFRLFAFKLAVMLYVFIVGLGIVLLKVSVTGRKRLNRQGRNRHPVDETAEIPRESRA